MFYVLALAGTAFVAFVWWRYTSVARGARQRDRRIYQMLDPVAAALEAKRLVTSEEIETLARKPQLRPMLYTLLKHFGRLELFPEEHRGAGSQGESLLAYWMMHPNELQDAPEVIVLVESVETEMNGAACTFFVYRYRMPEGHWAANGGWLLGLSGPFVDQEEPYSGTAGGFCRVGDTVGRITPGELVDWYVGLLKRDFG